MAGVVGIATLGFGVSEAAALGNHRPAYCRPGGTGKTLTGGNPAWGSEEPTNGTCNGDFEYIGIVKDVGNGDGQCAHVSAYVDGVWLYAYARSCSENGTGYNYQDANSFTPMYLGRSPVGGGSTNAYSATVNNYQF